jgi:hypothetical protein
MDKFNKACGAKAFMASSTLFNIIVPSEATDTGKVTPPIGSTHYLESPSLEVGEGEFSNMDVDKTKGPQAMQIPQEGVAGHSEHLNSYASFSQATQGEEENQEAARKGILKKEDQLLQSLQRGRGKARAKFVSFVNEVNIKEYTLEEDEINQKLEAYREVKERNEQKRTERIQKELEKEFESNHILLYEDRWESERINLENKRNSYTNRKAEEEERYAENIINFNAVKPNVLSHPEFYYTNGKNGIINNPSSRIDVLRYINDLDKKFK